MLRQWFHHRIHWRLAFGPWQLRAKWPERRDLKQRPSLASRSRSLGVKRTSGRRKSVRTAANMGALEFGLPSNLATSWAHRAARTAFCKVSGCCCSTDFCRVGTRPFVKMMALVWSSKSVVIRARPEKRDT